MPIPSRSHQTASLLKLNKAWAEATADIGGQAALLKKDAIVRNSLADHEWGKNSKLDVRCSAVASQREAGVM